MREPPTRYSERMARRQDPVAPLPSIPLTNGKSHPKAVKLNGHSSSSPASPPTTNGTSPVKRPPDTVSTYYGHDLEEISRILMQGLVDMGFTGAASALSHESGYEMEPASVAAFRAAVLHGHWDEAEVLLVGDDRFRRRSTDSRRIVHSRSPPKRGLRLRLDASLNTMLFQIRQQKFLELLEARDLGAALAVLRTELTPLNQDIGKLHSLSSLLMYESLADLKQQADWDGTGGTSRGQLLSELSRSISPSIMLPEKRLATLLQDLKDRQIADCIYHNTSDSPTLYSDHACDGSDFPRTPAAVFTHHGNEVWSLAFSKDGRRLATAGADGKVLLWDPQSLQLDCSLGEHMAGISFLSWSPDDRYLVSCDHTGRAKLWNVESKSCEVSIDTQVPDDPAEPISSCAWAPDGLSFVLGSLTKRTRQYNLRGDHLYEWHGRRVNGCDISVDGKYMVTVSRVPTQTINIYNFITHELETTIPLAHEPSFVSISRDCQSILVNTADNRVLLFSLANRDRTPVKVYTAHIHNRIDIKGCFGGADQRFIASGSQDGLIYIWHRANGQLLAALYGHTSCTNAVAWNPANPQMLASVGDDKRVIIWTTGEGSDQGGRAAAGGTEGKNGHSNGLLQPLQSTRDRGVHL